MRKVRAVVCLLFFCVCDVIVATVVLRNVCEHRRPCPKREAREFGRASPPPAGARCVCNCMTPFENWECEVFTIGTQGLQLRLRLPRATPLAGACWRRSRVAPARGREDGDAALGRKDETCRLCVRWRQKSARRRSVERGAARCSICLVSCVLSRSWCWRYVLGPTPPPAVRTTGSYGIS